MNLQLAVNAATDESHCTQCKRSKLTFAKHASVFYEPGATKLYLSSAVAQKNILSLSLCVKCDQQQQTHKKIDVSKSGIKLKKSIHRSPITIHPMFLAGRYSHKNAAVFAGIKGAFMSSVYGKPQCYEVRLCE